MAVFQTVRGLRPGKSVFDLSWEKKFTCDMGEIIPVMHDNVVPGDVFDIGYQMLVRAQPLAAPIMHPIYVTGHYFFISWRALCDYMVKEYSETFDFEEWLTGGKDGTDSQTVPTWDVTTNTEGSLWDYFTYPLGVDNANARPVEFKHWSYGWVWNEFFMDYNIDTAVDPDSQETILKARWEKDYFTSCLPWQQRGTSPAIAGSITGEDADITIKNTSDATARVWQTYTTGSGGDRTGLGTNPTGNAAARWADPSLQISGFDLADLRLSASTQKYMELSARVGARYTEHLTGFFGVSPRDERLQRPQYIGGFKEWLIVSEVLQTSGSATAGAVDVDTPQGTMTGHGIVVGSGHVCKFRATEYGHILALFTIRPKTLYHQGIDRQDLFSTRYEVYNPMFAGLSEQEVLTRELYCNGSNELDVFGYQGRYDEYRYRPSRVCGDFHADYDMWHCARQFSGVPTLSASFLECDPRDDWKADSSEDGFLVTFGNRIRAIRPMPFRATPGIGTL